MSKKKKKRKEGGGVVELLFDSMEKGGGLGDIPDTKRMAFEDKHTA